MWNWSYSGGTGGPGIVVLKSTTGLSTDSATNAPVSFDGTNYIATFKASANLTIGTAGTYTQFDYLVVGGGGGGGGRYAGGAGAGGYRTSFPGGTKIYLAEGSNTVTVGAGGAGGCGGAKGTPGVDSVIGTITSIGGGHGGSEGPGGDPERMVELVDQVVVQHIMLLQEVRNMWSRKFRWGFNSRISVRRWWRWWSF